MAFFSKARGYFVGRVRVQGEDRTRTGFKTKTAAERWERETRQSIERSHYDPQSPRTFQQATTSYLDDLHESGTTPSTIKEKRRLAFRFLKFLRYDPDLDEITKPLVIKFLHTRNRDSGGKHANRCARELRTFFNYFIEMGWMEGPNPASGIRKYQETLFRRYVPPAVDIGRVLSFTNMEQWVFLIIIMTTGARSGQIRNLKICDIDFDDHTILVRTKKRKENIEEVVLLGMPASLENLLHKYIATLPPTLFLFPGRNPQKVSTRNKWAKVLPRLCEQAKIKPFTLHGLRHFAAVTMRRDPENSIRDVMAQLGHKRESTTTIYLHELLGERSNANKSLERATLKITNGDLTPMEKFGGS